MSAYTPSGPLLMEHPDGRRAVVRGYVLPDEPTDTMVAAFRGEYDSTASRFASYDETVRRALRAVLAEIKKGN